jgi:hypothetical protein
LDLPLMNRPDLLTDDNAAARRAGVVAGLVGRALSPRVDVSMASRKRIVTRCSGFALLSRRSPRRRQ